MECLMLQLVGPLLHQLHGTRSTRAEDVDQQCEQQAEEDATEEYQRGVALSEDAAIDGSPKDVHVPTIVKVYRRRKRFLSATSGHERLVGSTSFVSEGDRYAGVAQQCRRQDRVGQNLSSGESDEVGSAARGGRRVAAVAIERRAQCQCGRTTQVVGGVGRLPGMGRSE